MTRQYQIDGVYLNETGATEYQVDGVYTNETVAGGDKTVSISTALDVTVALEGFPIAVNRTIQITG
jgi:hypothetical protein